MKEYKKNKYLCNTPLKVISSKINALKLLYLDLVMPNFNVISQNVE